MLAAQLRAARDQLQVLGLDAAAIQTVIDDADTSGALTVSAPFAGIIMERHATLGETVNREHSLFTVGDTSQLWAMIDVKEAEIPQLRVGQPVILELAGIRGRRFAGTLTWLSTEIDRRTSTMKARATVANPDGLLRAGMYGQARVSIRDRSQALMVPRESVQWDGCCNLVFVRHSDVLYEPRKVQLSYETDRYFLADSGVQAGEQIVTTGSFLMKTEIMKGNIGAGCCEVEPARN
jgi:cobalt-zinc-cadmium efflux system membrane fusion protein